MAENGKEPIGVTLWPTATVGIWGVIGTAVSIIGGGEAGAISLLVTLPLLTVALAWVVALTSVKGADC
jgi:hypothetical protein